MKDRKFYVERYSGKGSHVRELPGAAHVGVLLGSGDTIELSQPYGIDDHAEVRTRHGRLILTPQAANVVAVSSDGGGDPHFAGRILGPEAAEAALVDALRSCDELDRMVAAMERSSASTSPKANRLDRADDIRVFVHRIRKALR